MPERILLFGGTFDPVHVGHLIVARCLAEDLNAGRTLLIPTGINPLKRVPIASIEDRLGMLRAATEGEEGFDIFEWDLYRPPPSYTIETLEALRKREEANVEWCLAVGADMLADLPKWHRASDLLCAVRLAVALRPPLTSDATNSAVKRLAKQIFDKEPERLCASVVQSPLLDISSTDIRRRCREGRSIRYLVPEAVRGWIETRQLYRKP